MNFEDCFYYAKVGFFKIAKFGNIPTIAPKKQVGNHSVSDLRNSIHTVSRLSSAFRLLSESPVRFVSYLGKFFSLVEQVCCDFGEILHQ